MVIVGGGGGLGRELDWEGTTSPFLQYQMDPLFKRSKISKFQI